MADPAEYQYDVFNTPWGWFGVLGCEKGLVRTHLPAADNKSVESRLLDGIEDAGHSKKHFTALKKVILAYYSGRAVEFKEFKVYIDGFTPFQQHVLAALRNVTYGNTTTYGDLARLCNSPRASRAVGAVMASNPMPLIIPCHRVIKADGTIGQFSAPGGKITKKRMLELENKD